MAVGGSLFELKVELCKIKSGEIQTRTLSFSSHPKSFRDIRSEVEEYCSVPICVQTILYQNTEVQDDATPDSLYLRSGDTVVVIYPEKGLVKEVREVTKWLQQVYDIILSFQMAFSSGQQRPSIPEESMAILLNDDIANELTSLFSPWSDSQAKVNAEYFLSLGGLELMVKLHKLVIKLRKVQFVCHVNLPYFEYYISKAFANFAMDSRFSKCVAKCGGLEGCIETFLIKPADDQTLKINTTYVVLVTALRAIFNIAEVPEVHHELSLRHDVIDQAFLAASSPMYCEYALPRWTVSVLLCLSRSKIAHTNLLRPMLITNLIDLIEVHTAKEDLKGGSNEAMAMLTYGGVILAQLVTGSSQSLHGFPIPLLEKMAALMKKVCDGDCQAVLRYEESSHFYWGTFSPSLQFLYKRQEITDKILIDLKFNINPVKVLLQYLISSMGRSIHVDIVLKELLIDFVITLPWILPTCCKEKASQVVTEVGKFHQIQPPSLASISKAHLASRWGLEKLMEMNSISELLELRL